MSKQKLTPEQYLKIKDFMIYFVDHFMDLQVVLPERRPIAILDAIEKNSPSRAADSLLMAINDCIEMTMGWSTEKVNAIDIELKKRGIITLTELRRQHSKQYARIIKRGRINSENEYYLLKGVLDDGNSLEMPKDELNNLMQIIETYENKFTKKE